MHDKLRDKIAKVIHNVKEPKWDKPCWICQEVADKVIQLLKDEGLLKNKG